MSFPNQILVSVIIPTYNRADKITVALDSLMSQTNKNWECLVVDDGSTDNSLGVLKNYQEQDRRIRVFQRERLPKGAPTCRNIGINKAKGEYIIFLDSDDFMLSHCLEQRVEMINKFSTMDFLVFPLGEQKPNRLLKKDIPNHEDYLKLFLSASLPWSIMNPVWKKSFLHELGGFSEGYPRFNDPELMIRALLQPKVQFKVFHDMPFDTVFIPSKKDQKPFNEKVFISLNKFVPDMSKALVKHDKSGYKVYLLQYLHLWFKYFYIPSNSKPYYKSVVLIGMFFKQRIISLPKCFGLMFRLSLFQITNKVFKNPINKLTDKAIYLAKND